MTLSPKSKLVALLLCFFLGGWGVHRFYVGKIGTGILYLLTGGLFLIGIIVDFVNILTNNFKDRQGHLISLWRLDDFDDEKQKEKAAQKTNQSWQIFTY